MKEKIVCVEWEDASYNSGYYDKKTPEQFEPLRTTTVGHLVKTTAKGVIVCQDRFHDKDGKISDERHISVIPKKMIKKIIYLTGE